MARASAPLVSNKIAGGGGTTPATSDRAIVAASIGGAGSVSGAATSKPTLRSAAVVSAARIAPSGSVSVTIATFLPFAPPSSARSCTPHAGFPVFDRVASDAPVMPKPHGLANHSGAVATPTNGRRSVAKVDASCAMPTAGTTANASSASRATAAVSATGLAPAYVMVRPPTRPCALARSKRALRAEVGALAPRVADHQPADLHRGRSHAPFGRSRCHRRHRRGQRHERRHHQSDTRDHQRVHGYGLTFTTFPHV